MPHSGSSPGTYRGQQSALTIVSALALTMNVAYAGTVPACDSAVMTLTETAELLRVDTDELSRLAARNEIPARRIGESWRFNCAAVLVWLNGDWMPVESLSRLSEQDMTKVRAAGAAQEKDTASKNEPSAARPPEEPIGEAPRERTAEDVFLRDQRVLLRRGDSTLNFGHFYLESTRQLLTSIDSRIVLANVEQTSLLTTFQARFGVGDEIEFFTGATYADSNNDLLLGNEKLSSTGRSEFGNVLLGVRRTLVQEGLGRPNVIAALSAHVPTGDTSRAISGGFSFVKSIDPVALFGSVNYTRTFSENFADIRRLQPEHRLDANVGFALALNDTLSLSTSMSAAFTAATRFPNATLRQQDVFGLTFGLTSRLGRSFYMEPTVSFSLGGPGDSLAFGVSVFSF
jgi:excisionase family DNA binding protein